MDKAAHMRCVCVCLINVLEGKCDKDNIGLQICTKYDILNKGNVTSNLHRRTTT